VDTIVPVFVHEMAAFVSTVVPVLAHEITISAGIDFISTYEIAKNVGTNMLVLANETATFVGTVVYVLNSQTGYFCGHRPACFCSRIIDF